ncbi:MAG: hypothetical protein EDX89_07610 [Acidobacteria bacterium]|nr:MAG: hypothetical protein EDX89_07610 [Acidobacteriota bacterium]MCE7956755.1 hypothetical protein [Acidobacteria bacterium ACB2]
MPRRWNYGRIRPRGPRDPRGGGHVSNRSRSGHSVWRVVVRGLASAAALLLPVAGATKAGAQQLTFTHLAGSLGGPGWFDGVGSAARFHNPWDVAIDSFGNLYIADEYNHTIRRMTPAGDVTTLAGLAGTHGSADGAGSAARFLWPSGVAVDASGNVYVADSGNNTIRKVTPEGAVTTLAGQAGIQGSTDGSGTAARFLWPSGVAVDASGNVYVADSGNDTIRKVTPGGVVTTLAGRAGSSGSADGAGSEAQFWSPVGVAVDASGDVLVADLANNTIRKVTPAGVVTTMAGLAGSHGSKDGPGSTARFWEPRGTTVDASGNVYVADGRNHSIRRVTPAGEVTTLAGLAAGFGSEDGTGISARFHHPEGVAADASGSLYVADKYNHTIRKVTAESVVTTLAGVGGGLGSTDGTGSAARFFQPSGVAVDGSGNIYVTDQGNNTIRRVTPAGVVTTLAGLAGTTGSSDGTGSAARFLAPAGLAVDASGNIYVSDGYNHTIRKVTAAGVVTTLAGLGGSPGSLDGTGSAARFYRPKGVAVDATGSLYVADEDNHTVRKVTPAGVVTTLAGLPGSTGSSDGTGSAARFYSPWGVVVDASGDAYVADGHNCTIRKVTAAGDVTTLAGLGGNSGSSDGTGSAARFFSPSGIALDTSGNVCVADSDNNTIRKGVLDSIALAVRFESPVGGEVAGLVDVVMTATGGIGASLSSIRLQTDGRDVGSCYSSPCTVIWSAARESLGAHNLRAVATNSLGLTASAEVVVNVKPVLSGQLRLADPDGSGSWTIQPTAPTTGAVTVECSSPQWRFHVAARTDGSYTSRSAGAAAEESISACASGLALGAELTYRDQINGNTWVAGPPGGYLERTSRLAGQSVTVPSGLPLIRDVSLKGILVLLHGIRSGHAKWNDWAGYLADSGYVVFTPTYTDQYVPYVVPQPHSAAGTEVWGEIQSDLDGLPSAAPLYLICHSRGGVVARAMFWDDQYPTSASRIKRVFTLGSPHSGTDLADLAGAPWDLAVFQMFDFNSFFPSFGTVPTDQVFAIGGRGLLFGDSGDCERVDDGVVYWNSPPELVNASPFHIATSGPGNSVVMREKLEGYIPGSQDICGGGGGHNFPYGHVQLGDKVTREEILVRTILPVMATNPASWETSERSGRTPAAVRSVTNQPPPRQEPIASTTQVVAGSGVLSLAVPVSSTDRLWAIVTPQDFDVVVEFTRPGGIDITPANAVSMPGVRYHKDGLVQTVEVAGALVSAGTWTLRATSLSMGSQTISAALYENSRFGLSAATGSREYLFGSTGHLSARLSGDTAAGLLGSVVAEMRNTSGVVVATVTLYDDGAHGDGGAGDWQWGSDFAVPSTPGWYSFLVRGAGTLNLGGPGGGGGGEAFQRVAIAGFAALGSSNPRTGGYGFISEDTDGDGKFDQIRFTLGLALPGPGTFRLSGDLQDGNGYPISHAVGSRTVSAAGSGTIDLLFPVRGLDCSRFSTFFRVTGLRMTAGNGATPYASIGQVGGPDFPGFECVTGNPPGPTIVMVSPDGAFPGESRTVTISGSGFHPCATVSFGAGIGTQGGPCGGEGGQPALTSLIAVDAGATPGPRDVVVTNPDGRSASLAGGFTVGSNQPPQVLVSSPRSGDVVVGTVPVSFAAQASDDLGLQQVAFSIHMGGGWWLNVPPVSSFPYRANLDMSSWGSGAYEVYAVATDTGGLTTSSPVVQFYLCNSFPTAVVSGGGTTCPAPGATVQAALTGTGPWTLTWSDGFAQTATSSPAVRTVTPGSTTTYTLTALSDASCAAGRFTGEATVQVGALPAPELTAPTRVQAGTTGIVASTPAVAGDVYVWTVTNGLVTGGQGTSQVTFTAGAPGTLTVRLDRTTASGCRHEEATAAVQVLGPASASLFHTVAPCRILDTRGDEGSFGGPALQPGATRVFPVSLASCGIPPSARSITANVTVVAPEAAGFLTLYPADGPMPPTSTINFRPGQTRANNAVVALAPDGTGGLKVFTGSPGAVHLILDVNGYFECSPSVCGSGGGGGARQTPSGESPGITK